MSFDFDQELQSYFTDVEHLRDLFKQWIAAPTLPKRLLVIHGVGGVGKSSLLRMFRLHCKSVNMPVALASGDEQKSALDVLARWTDDLKADSVAFPSFGKTFEHYRAIQAKVENESAKTAEKLAKGATKTIIETAASTIPGVGPLVGKLGGMGVEALTDWLFSRGFKKPDVDLLLDPAKKLTEDFLSDVTNVVSKRRLVLMLDTFEQMSALQDWAREVAQRLPANVLLVIAGRALPNWERAWSGWMANAQVEELKPMSEEVMRELIRRYYATMLGGEPNPTQVDAIIRFARGLPMVVTSAVRLWIKYGVEDFQAIKPEIVANLVDRLMEGVPKELIPALEAAATVRWFDQPILRAVMKQDDVRDVFNELRRFPFVRTRAEGLALHDAVRGIMDENLRAQDAERHCELHERAAAYFEKRLSDLETNGMRRSLDWKSAALELIQHSIICNENKGVYLAISILEESMSVLDFAFCDVLINQVHERPFKITTNRDWINYYRLLIDYRRRTKNVEGVVMEYRKLLSTSDPNLKCYVAHSLGEIALGAGDYIEGEKWFTYGIEIVASLKNQPISHSAIYGRLLRGKGYALRRRRIFEQSIAYYEQAEKLSYEIGDWAGLVHTYQMIGGIYRDQEKYSDAIEYYLKAIATIDEHKSELTEAHRAGIYNTIAHTLILEGNLASAEQKAQEALKIARSMNNVHETLGSLGHILTVSFITSNWRSIQDVSTEIENLGITYGYPDHLARLELVRGHIMWVADGESAGHNFASAFHHYQRAMLYALSHNRITLDAVISGRPLESILPSITHYSLGRGEEGRQMLLALRDWWKTGVNDIGTPRPDTISPIPEGIPLLEAERIAREREPGDGLPQKSVVEQIENALKEMGAG